MDIHDSVAVVTGANRGLGRHFAAQLLERGAARVYVEPAQKSDPADVAAAALDGLAAGATEVLADEVTQDIKQQLSAAPAAV